MVQNYSTVFLVSPGALYEDITVHVHSEVGGGSMNTTVSVSWLTIDTDTKRLEASKQGLDKLERVGYLKLDVDTKSV